MVRDLLAKKGCERMIRGFLYAVFPILLCFAFAKYCLITHQILVAIFCMIMAVIVGISGVYAIYKSYCTPRDRGDASNDTERTE